jgi:hypothetical protein
MTSRGVGRRVWEDRDAPGPPRSGRVPVPLWEGHEMQGSSSVADVRRTALPVFLALALLLSLTSVLPASAHPEDCATTDGAAQDDDCEDSKDAGSEEGEAVYLDEHTDAVLGKGSDGVFDSSRNMHPLGFSENAVPLSGAGSGVNNSDLAFWGDHAIQGTYNGFRIIDISEPSNPVELVNFEDCVAPGSALGSQGDVVVYGDVLVRSWDAPRGSTLDCGGVPTPAGQEGVHVFDISDPTAPQALTFVATPCGSHTASGVPDLDNGRLLVYSSPSSGAVGCRGIDIIEVPLAAPGDASYLRFVPSGDPVQPPKVTVDDGSAAGEYIATAAGYGPTPDADGVSGDIVYVGLGCDTLVDFPEGAIALADRGVCPFVDKTANAEAAGAVTLIVANNAAGTISMGGSGTFAIPSVMISQADGNTIKAGLPASGGVSQEDPPASPDRACHDTGVILGDVNLAACAGGDGFSVWSMDPADGGSLEEPALLYSQSIEGVTIGHSAAFTWDGEVLVYGHEPGGGGQARCQESSPDVDKTMFFFEPRTGVELGTWMVERPQSATENCTIHNYNVVPTDKGYILVSGNYQMGIAVIDFTDPANAKEIAYADPAPLSETSLVTGGDWSSYWYNGHIYQSDIRRGLIIWKLSDPAVAGAKKFGHLNPQTQETSFGRSPAFGKGPRGR